MPAVVASAGARWTEQFLRRGVYTVSTAGKAAIVRADTLMIIGWLECYFGGGLSAIFSQFVGLDCAQAQPRTPLQIPIIGNPRAESRPSSVVPATVSLKRKTV